MNDYFKVLPQRTYYNKFIIHHTQCKFTINYSLKILQLYNKNNKPELTAAAQNQLYNTAGKYGFQSKLRLRREYAH